MDVDSRGVRFTEIQDYCSKTFRHVAESKGLDFGIEWANRCPVKYAHRCQTLQQC